MANFPFRPTVEQLGYLRAAVAPISDIQQQLCANDAAPLTVNDRIAHQYQIAGGEVLLRIEAQLPKSLLGVVAGKSVLADGVVPLTDASDPACARDQGLS